MPLQRPNIIYVGKYSYCTAQPVVWNRKQTKIGSFVSIGSRVIIGNGTHPLNFLTTSPFLYLDRLGYKTQNTDSHNEYEDLEPVIIGNDVWIGDDVKIQNGVKIGDGAVIGTSAIVTKDVPPYAVVVGIPAKVIKYRFEQDIINELLELRWWDLGDDIIKKIPYDDIEKAIKYLKYPPRVRRKIVKCRVDFISLSFFSTFLYFCYHFKYFSMQGETQVNTGMSNQYNFRQSCR